MVVSKEVIAYDDSNDNIIVAIAFMLNEANENEKQTCFNLDAVFNI
jgi:hypothetical protein